MATSDGPASQRTSTFLFTDVEGSTQLLSRVGDDYPALLERHRTLLRDAFGRHGGQEQGTEGDSFFVVFDTAADAVRACFDAQLALLAEPWPSGREVRVRMGLHSGTATFQGADVFGLAVHQAARVGASAHGGQIIASEITRQLAGDVPTPSGSWRDLGAHQLKDIDGPARLFQLVHPELPTDFPPLRARAVQRSNLPRQATRLIGRKDEVSRLQRDLGTSHLVTVTGAGGVGKTRLAIEMANQLLEELEDGAWLIELAPITEGADVPSTIGIPFGIRPGPPDRVLDLLVEHLRDREVLILLDNCEHVLEPSAAAASRLLDNCPGLRLVATSRERLGLPGELVHRLPSLTVPDEVDDVAGLVAAEATELFLERAASVDPDFDLAPDELNTVVEICARLDGMPLAIELAAARVDVLSLADIAARLDDRFRLLTGGSRMRDPRQQTLRAAVEWSHGLLDETEQSVFRQLSVFVDDFTLDAVEGIARTPGPESSDVVEILGSLVAKSLVVVDRSGKSRRYRLLETMRQFGAEVLANEDGLEAVSRRHAEWFSSWAMREFERSGASVMDGDVGVIERERPNLLAALRWGLAEHDDEVAIAAGLPLSAVWLARDYFDEGCRWMGRLLGSLPASPRLGAVHVLQSAMLLSHNADAHAGADHVCEGVEILRSGGEDDSWIVSFGVSMHGVALAWVGAPDEGRPR